MCDVAKVQKIAHCLGVAPGKVQLNEEQVVTRTSGQKKSVAGFATILESLANESKSETAQNSKVSREVEAQVYQWIEFSVLYVAPGSRDRNVAKQLLGDLNKLFASKSYLVGHFITLADLAVYYAIYDLVKSLSPVEKEAYLNLSRWFDHLQNRPDVHQGEPLLNFTTIYLHGWATGTHI
ncbi:eukaryotic translation elongation factor 1 epsilon-1 [Drosophila pseudoobscura]|uniref:Eukaryotic translation elongation factor 1 epsilon-1 n=1 Tax=Drosophila pseudoobscura pseudoobscura TaxID=46245 RepID=A0A6I8UUQ9_DROPS|nr:eukaryotic translation elongation factor 1 epsilon-1 [Drosophila pseudoobscura]